MRRIKKDYINRNVICKCGYQNLPENVAKYGTCKGCGRIIDNKAYFDRVMAYKLHIKRRGER